MKNYEIAVKLEHLFVVLDIMKEDIMHDYEYEWKLINDMCNELKKLTGKEKMKDIIKEIMNG